MSTSPHFIRCIIPNEQKASGKNYSLNSYMNQADS